MPAKKTFEIGLQLPEAERVVRWPELLAMARLAEESGYDSLWVGDHLLYRVPGVDKAPWEAWSMLGALAAATERITLGPLVASTSFHAPALLAKKASTIDEVSGGRLVLGLGAGWNEGEYRAFGSHNARITALCHELGRNPEDISRTAAVLVGATGGTGRPSLYEGGPPSPPLTGSTEEIAAGLREFADQGADHLLLVLDPITLDSIREIAPAVELAKAM